MRLTQISVRLFETAAILMAISAAGTTPVHAASPTSQQAQSSVSEDASTSSSASDTTDQSQSSTPADSPAPTVTAPSEATQAKTDEATVEQEASGTTPVDEQPATTVEAPQPTTVNLYATANKLAAVFATGDSQAVISHIAAGTMLHLIQKVTGSDDTVRYQVVNAAGKQLGYVAATDLALLSGPQGNPVTVSLYKTLISAKAPIYADFNGTIAIPAGQRTNKTYRVIAQYHHFNGTVYDQLVDHQGHQIGYVDDAAMRSGSGTAGAGLKTSQYATVLKKGYDYYKQFGQKAFSTSQAHLYTTYKVNYLHNAFDGTTWASIYDNRGLFVALVDFAALRTGSGTAGAGYGYVTYATTLKVQRGYYRTFGAKPFDTTSRHVFTTYQLKYLHHAFNGTYYASAYNGKSQFIAIIDLAAFRKAAGQQGITILSGLKVVITSRTAGMWSDFNWRKKSTTAAYYGHQYAAKAYYNHINGSTYLSLYSGSRWLGYLNRAFTRDVKAKVYIKLNVVNYNQYANGLPEGCEGVSLLEALKYKHKALSYSPRGFLSTIPKASSPYRGFVGSPFTSSNQYTAIFAAPLAQWGKRFGNVVNISGSSVNALLQEVLKGNPVVVYVTIHFAPLQWAKWPFGTVPNNNHAVTLCGYNQAASQVYVSDPIDGRYWLSLSKFSAIYNARKMAVVVR